MVDRIGIVGAGQMGGGIAHVAALAGLEVALVDVDPEQIAKALATIAGNLDRQVKRGKIGADDKEAALLRISPPRASSRRSRPAIW